jgi:ribulose-phosphate 3-epimerase
MIYNPLMYIERFVEAGADLITFHFEATEDVEDVIKYIKKCNVRVGLAFKPGTSDSFILKYLDQIDLVLIMTVEPGFGGQAFMSDMLNKISFVKDACEKYTNRRVGVVSKESKEFPLHIEVDGGIDVQTAKQCVAAGANTLVAGTSLYGAQDMSKEIKALHALG